MKKLLVIVGLFFSMTAYSQIGDRFNGTINVYTVPDNTGPVFRFSAFYNDPSGRWASDSTRVGDDVFAFTGNKAYKFTVDSILSKTGGIIHIRVRDSTATVSSFPTGVCAIMRPTSNNMYPSELAGLTNVLASKIATYFADLADDASVDLTGYATEDQVGDTSALLRGLISVAQDSGENKLGISTLTQNKFIFANGSKTGSTTLSYLNRELNRIFLDSLISFQVGRWTTGGRPASILNGLVGYNSTLNLFDVGVNGAWRNLVVSNGALTSGGVPYVDASGHLAYDAGLTFTSGSPHDILRVGGTVASPSAPLVIKSTGNTNTLQLRSSGDTYNVTTISDDGTLTISGGSGSSARLRLNGGKGFGGYPSAAFWDFSSGNGLMGMGSSVAASNTTPSIQLYGLSSTSTGTNANIVYIDTEHSSSFGGGSTAGTGSIDILEVGGVINQTVSSKSVTSVNIAPSVTAMVGTYTALSIGPNTGNAIYQSGTSAKNTLAGNTRFGGITAPTAAVDITGRLKVSVRDSTTSAVEIAAWTVNGTATKATIGPNLTFVGGVLDAVAGLSEITGMCVDTVAQTGHGFALGDIVYWTGSAYADFVGTTGDTIIPSGVVTESITANSFSYATCGIIDNDFSLPDGLYYATGAGFNLVPDTLQIPILKVEGAKSTVITPVPYSQEVGTVELFTIVTDTGNVVVYGGDSFDLPEAIRSDELGVETSTTPTTAAKFTIHLVDCTGGAKTVTPPASPVSGDWFAVSDSRGNSGTNNITVDTSTDKFHAAAADFIMNVDRLFVRFTYVNSTVGWIKSN